MRKSRKNIIFVILCIFLGVFFYINLNDKILARDIYFEIPANIYENDEKIGETIVIIDGSLKRFGEKSFLGKFYIEAVEKNGIK